MLLSGLYAVLQLCNSANGDQRNVLTHTAVLLLSANRELNLKRRDLIRPDLNKQYAPLCNPSTAVSTFLFGDDLNKEVKELTKSQKLSNKVNPKRRMEPYKVPAFRGVCRRGRFSQSAGRGRAPSYSFLGQGLGHTRPPAESQDLGNKDPVGSPAEVSQTTLATIIAIKFLLRLEDCETVFMYGRLSHQILLSLMQLLIVILNLTGNLEYILVLLALLVPFSEIEQTIINNEVEKFLFKGIIRLSSHEGGQVISLIFTRPKKDGSHRVIFDLKKLNESVTYHHFKMNTLETAIRLMRPGGYMTSIDLKDAYYSIPIAEEHQKYLKFIWRNQLYAFTSLPMGLTSSHRIFTNVLKPVFSYLRSQFGHTCLGYIDDSFYMKDGYTECEEATLHAIQPFVSLGFKIHPEKSVIIPT